MIGAIRTGKRLDDLNSLYFRYDPLVKKEKNDSVMFALTLIKNDRIWLVNAPNDVSLSLKPVMIENWPKGIEIELLKQNFYEFKLKGEPFWFSRTNSTDSRRLVSSILNELRENYWNLYCTCELSAHYNAKTVFFFRKDSTLKMKQFNRILSINLNDSDKIRIINGNEKDISAIRSSIISSWPYDIQYQKDFDSYSQLKIRGNPFKGNSYNPVYVTIMLMNMIDNLQNQGLTFFCNCNISGKYQSKDISVCPIDRNSFCFIGRKN
jgi:hypothetical protein